MRLNAMRKEFDWVEMHFDQVRIRFDWMKINGEQPAGTYPLAVAA